MRVGLVGLGVVAILAGGGLLGLARSPVPAPPDTAPDVAVAIARAGAQIDLEIAAARTRVPAHARALAAREIVRSVIVTDAASATDALSPVDLVPAGGRVEVGQIVGPERRTLFRAPARTGAEPAAGDRAAGMYLDPVGATVWISEIAEVVPRTMRDPEGHETAPYENGYPVTGYVMVSQPIALEAIVRQHLPAPVAGRFELGAHVHPLGDAAPAADARTVTQPLPSLFQARIVVAVPPPPRAARRSPAALLGGIGTLALGCVLVGLGVVLRRPHARTAARAGSAVARADREPASRPLPTPPAVRPRTQPGGAEVVPPVFELDETVVDPSTSQAFAPTSGPFASAGTPVPLADRGGAVAIRPAVARPGSTIGRWELVRQIGSGGMADVYLAQARGEGGFEKQVAIKVMHPHLARNPQTVAHFLDEARLAAGLAHQNIVAVHDLGRLGDDYFIVMEYIDGLDLEQLLALARAGERAVPVHIGLGILRRICDGLNAAHQATSRDGAPLGIVHRDVKSANVLVSRQGAVKVVDFGIAKATAQLHETAAGETKGTPSVMAPEQRTGGAVDVRADVYAVGAIGYEMLTGQLVDIDFVTLAHRGLANWPHLDAPTQVRPDLPPELDALLFAAMAFAPADRPADCAELEARLDAVMARYGLAASDKDIARWMRAELQLRAPELLARIANALSSSK